MFIVIENLYDEFVLIEHTVYPLGGWAPKDPLFSIVLLGFVQLEL